VEKKIGNLVGTIEDGSIDYDILSEHLKTLKKRREELQVYLDSVGSPFSDLAEGMVLKYLSAIQGNVFNRLISYQKRKSWTCMSTKLRFSLNKVAVNSKIIFTGG
jgi:hypothetical protein